MRLSTAPPSCTACTERVLFHVQTITDRQHLHAITIMKSEVGDAFLVVNAVLWCNVAKITQRSGRADSVR
jgi:hypothetical protein